MSIKNNHFEKNVADLGPAIRLLGYKHETVIKEIIAKN